MPPSQETVLLEQALIAFWSDFRADFRNEKRRTLPGTVRDACTRNPAPGRHAHDPAHDLNHVRRVARLAGNIARTEGGNARIVTAAAWLHDLVNIPKDSPERALASRRSARAARDILARLGYSAAEREAICHAIEAHSFSAGIEPLTLEAGIVQDADRLEALGAIGIARCFSTGGSLSRALWHDDDPLAEHRLPDDGVYTLDHFFVKLFRLPETFRTAAGRAEAEKRAAFMRQFAAALAGELRG